MMNLFSFFRNTLHKEKPGKFADFLLNASDDKKEKIFGEVARKANEEQRELFLRSNLKTKPGC